MSVLNRVASSVRRMNENRRVINELRSMSDRELSDIGLSRGDITRAVRG
ncbi:MAG: DUF1127 domain-containing protein [Alphaproteobacteria bacterium]